MKKKASEKEEEVNEEEEDEETKKQKEMQKKKGLQWTGRGRCSSRAARVLERDEEPLHEEDLEERRGDTAEWERCGVMMCS